MDCRVLTVRQPWAGLLVAGVKDVENRVWKTAYRGLLLIHAAQRIDREDLERYRNLLDEVPTSAVIGAVQLVDCKWEGMLGVSPWAEPQNFHWIVQTVGRCRPVPASGRLGLWRPTESLLEKVLPELDLPRA